MKILVGINLYSTPHFCSSASLDRIQVGGEQKLVIRGDDSMGGVLPVEIDPWTPTPHPQPKNPRPAE